MDFHKNRAEGNGRGIGRRYASGGVPYSAPCGGTVGYRPPPPSSPASQKPTGEYRCRVSFLFILGIDGSPTGLVANWVAECSEAFPNKELRAKPMSPEFDQDRDPFTLWVWSNSELQGNKGEEYSRMLARTENRILTIAIDESHEIVRNPDSKRCQNLRPILQASEMNIFVSGTPFVLGARTDCYPTFLMLGGDPAWRGSKWGKAGLGDRLSAICQRQSTKHYDLPMNYPARDLRLFYTPFWISRGDRSTYTKQPEKPGELPRKEWIIPRVRGRPPVLPARLSDYLPCVSGKPGVKAPDPFEQEALQATFTQSLVSRAAATVNVAALQKKSELQMQIAWFGHELFEVYLEAGDSPERAEAVFHRVQRRAPSPRVACLIGYSKYCKNNKEKFVIVAERISLTRLAVYVFSSSEFSSD